MELKRIEPWSAAKISGAINAAMGVIVGMLFALGSMIGGLVGQGAEEGALFGAVFGVGAVIVLPVFYGVIGLVAGALGAWLYNVFAGVVGGIELQLEQPGGTAIRQS